MLISTLAIAIIGLIVGSFLANVVYRLKMEEQYVKGRSKCPHCKHELKPLDLIPVLSWAALRGRCRYCSKKISAEYSLTELLTAILFGASFLALQPVGLLELTQFVLWLVILSGLIILAVYDLKWYLLPDKILLPLMVPAALLLILAFVASGSINVIVGPLIASFVFGGFFYLLAAVSNGHWMGGGDIKLSFLMGLLLGVQKTALAMFIAFNGAAIVGLTLILTKRLNKNSHIPFGPFLIAGTIVAYLVGSDLINWYIESSGLNLIFL